MEQSVDSSCRSYTLVALPMELLIYIFSFVTSTRERVKLRYVSQRLRAAMETSLLWRDFIWPHFDFSEERSINSVLHACGTHVKQLSFPDLVIPLKSLQLCRNVVQLSLPSTKLSLTQLKTIMQSMRKLQYLDCLWTSKNDIRHLLWIVGYPAYGYTIKELTIREQVKDSSFHEAFYFLLNEWMAFNLIPHTLNVVTKAFWMVHDAYDKWIPIKRLPPGHGGHVRVYDTLMSSIGLAPIFPILQLEFTNKCIQQPIINAGFLGLDRSLMLSDCTVGNGNVLHKAIMHKTRNDDIRDGPLNSNVEFLTHFSVTRCDEFSSDHLEQLAIACPNLQQLNLLKNVNCLKSLQGLCAIANCRNLQGLNILGISVKQVKSCVQLWEILVDLQLTNLAIDICCLLCFEDDQTKQIIIGLHQKCLNMKSLESLCIETCTWCTKCVKNEQLQLSNFPSLIHCISINIERINISEKLKYLWYVGGLVSCSLPIANYSLQELCIESDWLALPDSFMNTISAHCGLVHIILSVNAVTQNGIATLIKNSPNLITCHIYIRTAAVWRILFNSKDFRSSLKKKYSHRKLFFCGSYLLMKGKISRRELCDLHLLHNMDFVSLWRYDKT